MADKKKVCLEAHLKIPPELGSLVQEMAASRHMEVNTLLSELVHLGIISLKPKPVPIDAWRQNPNTIH